MGPPPPPPPPSFSHVCIHLFPCPVPMFPPPVSLDDDAQSGDFEDTFEHAVADMLDVPPEQVRLTACALLFGLLRRFSLSLAEPIRHNEPL